MKATPAGLTLGRMIRQSLRFNARSHLGVVLGAMVGSAALMGALVVGDSVRESLKARAEARLGAVDFALQSGDRLFTAAMADGFNQPVATALQVRGTAARQDGGARAHQVQIYGVDSRFWTFAPSPSNATATVERPAPGQVLINAALAAQLETRAGDSLILRFARPSSLSQDAVLRSRNDANAALRVVVAEVLGPEAFGEFSLQASQRPSLNAFVNPSDLARLAGITNRANLLLARHPGSTTPETEAGLGDVQAQLERAWKLEDAELTARIVTLPTLPNSASTNESPLEMIEIGTPRVFLAPSIVAAANSLTAQAHPVVTYLANAIRAGDRLTPYSMVTAAGPPWTPADLKEDEIVLLDWLASDLGVKAGDPVELVYFDPEAGARLIERTNTFTVRSIVPLSGLYADRSLMPDIPGLANAETTSDWDAGFELVHRIRDQDEAYWDKHRGTPKAFISPPAGHALWNNRFGAITSIRFMVPPGQSAAELRDSIAAQLRAKLRPTDVGFAFQPVRDQAMKAATSGQDFGGLFLGFSLFLVVAALLLMALLFRFGLEQRLPEVGTLLALGFRPATVRKLWLGEGVALAFLGGLLGVGAGLAYARAMIHGLTTLWRDAVAGSSLEFHATAASLVTGLAASVIVGGAVIAWTLRRQFNRPARELLAGEIATTPRHQRSCGIGVGMVSLAGALALIGWAILGGHTTNPGVFFGAGSLLLIAGLAFMAGWLSRIQSGPRRTAHSVDLADRFESRDLAIRGTARRRSRSLSTAALLACGTFLISAIGAFRMDATQDAWERRSGTGGFAWIGETSLPVSQDLNSAAGLEFFGLDPSDLPGVRFVPFRVRQGDDASCLNLNRAQTPTVLGVDPSELAGRGAFRFARVVEGIDPTAGWTALETPLAGSESPVPEIAAIGDAASIQWALGRKVGDALPMTDERGEPFQLRLVGGVANSILQGNLVIAESDFARLFPGESGYRFFLIDAPTNEVQRTAIATTLSRGLSDVGLQLTPATRRLAEFNAVQNTYLSTFQVLGGLGLLLGSAGLGVVVLRNVLERRGELALMSAVGFRRKQLARLVLAEHGALLLLGLGIGLVSAAVAILPSILAPAADLPVMSLSLTLGGVFVAGIVTTWLATRAALRGSLLAALRGE